MSVDFYAAKAPADPTDLADWQLGAECVNVTGTSAGQLLTLLGYAHTIEAGPAGDADPAEFLARIDTARVEGLAFADQHWGGGHHPGYFEVRLAQLAGVAREAQAIGGQVAWA